MRKIVYAFLFVIILCGCTNHTTSSSSLNSAIHNDETTTAPTENVSAENPIESTEIVSDNLLRDAVLNIVKIEYYPNEVTGMKNSEPQYLKDIPFEYYAFSMIDINFDGQRDVCLYSTTHEDQFLRVLFVENGKVYASGIQTYGFEIVDEGYAVAVNDKQFIVEKANFITQDNDRILCINYVHNIFTYEGVEVSAEEAESHRADYPYTQAIKYDFTEENIREYIK